MSKFKELVNDFTIMADHGAVIFSSYESFVEFIEEIVIYERKREREACAKVCDELAAQDKLSNYYGVAARAIRERGEI